MASITKHGKRFRAHVAVKGKRSSKIFDTKRDAMEWSIEQETLFSNGKETIGGYSVKNAFERYSEEVSPSKKGERWEVIRLKKLSRDKIAFLPIEKIERTDLEDWINRQTIGAGSIIRELNLIQAVMKQARRWKWTNANPFVDLEKPQAPSHRERLITEQEIALIADAKPNKRPDIQYSKSQQVPLIFLLALETAMRKGEILSLAWEHVHLDKKYAHLPETKNGKSRDVPLNKKAVKLLKQMIPKSEGRVFTIGSASFDQLFRRLKKSCKLEGFTFHDTRHTAITRMASKLSVLELARTVGHSDPRSLMWYYNESAESLASKLD